MRPVGVRRGTGPRGGSLVAPRGLAGHKIGGPRRRAHQRRLPADHHGLLGRDVHLHGQLRRRWRAHDAPARPPVRERRSARLPPSGLRPRDRGRMAAPSHGGHPVGLALGPPCAHRRRRSRCERRGRALLRHGVRRRGRAGGRPVLRRERLLRRRPSGPTTFDDRRRDASVGRHSRRRLGSRRTRLARPHRRPAHAGAPARALARLGGPGAR